MAKHPTGFISVLPPPSHDSIIGGLPQLNSVDYNYFILLIDLIKHPVFSFSDSIPVSPSSQLCDTLRKGVISQYLDISIDSDILDSDFIHPVSTCASDTPHNPLFLRFSALQNP